MTTSMHSDAEHLVGVRQPDYKSTCTAAPEYYYYDDNGLDEDSPKQRRHNVLYYIVIALVSIFLVYGYFQLVLGVESIYIRVPDLVRVQTLQRHHSPAYYDARRLIVVGDIHGKFKSLKKLLAKIDYASETDHLVFLGDMVSKGPNSLEVLDFAIDHNVSCVRGNHEDSILHQYAALHRLPAPRIEPPFVGVDDNRFRTTFVPASDKAVARKLKPKHIAYLGTCPAILDLGAVGFHNTSAVAVHAGLQWNIPNLEDQIPEVVFTMRSLLPPALTTPSEETDGEPWSKVWNQKQKEKPRDKRVSVFYGHNARDGLIKHRYTAGIDTGCASGGKLTALIISRDDDGVLQHDLSSVKC
jgi:bis(5'-nucleosyl)-tetraphosphatase (symmetrical)